MTLSLCMLSVRVPQQPTTRKPLPHPVGSIVSTRCQLRVGFKSSQIMNTTWRRNQAKVSLCVQPSVTVSLGGSNIRENAAVRSPGLAATGRLHSHQYRALPGRKSEWEGNEIGGLSQKMKLGWPRDEVSVAER